MISGPANMAWMAGILTGVERACHNVSLVTGAFRSLSVMTARSPVSTKAAYSFLSVMFSLFLNRSPRPAAHPAELFELRRCHGAVARLTENDAH